MTWTEEQRRAQSERQKRVWAQRTENEKNEMFARIGPKVAQANRGKKRTPEQRERMRRAALENRDNRKRAADTRWSRVPPEERGAVLRKFIEAGASAMRGKRLPPERARASRQQLANNLRDPRIRAKTRDNAKKALQRPEVRQHVRQGRRRYWDSLTPEQRAAHPWVVAGQEASFMRRPSSLEKAIAAEMDGLGIFYRAQKRIGPYVVDFHIADWDVVVECDGEYWHTLPGRPEADAERDAFLRNKGCRVVRLKEAAIKNSPIRALVAGLREALASKGVTS